MTFSAPQLRLDELLAVAARLGYDGIEPRIGSGHCAGCYVIRFCSWIALVASTGVALESG